MIDQLHLSHEGDPLVTPSETTELTTTTTTPSDIEELIDAANDPQTLVIVGITVAAAIITAVACRRFDRNSR